MHDGREGANADADPPDKRVIAVQVIHPPAQPDTHEAADLMPDRAADETGIEALIELMARLPGLGPRSARRAVLERRIREVTVERDLQALERGVERYREMMGVAP